jgi:hypothetical protein
VKYSVGKFNRWRVGFILVLVFVVEFLFSYPDLWRKVIGPFHFPAESIAYPFLDMHGRLAAFEAHREGIDILHQPNPYDPKQRVNIKPTWPLHLSFLGLGREHLMAAGIITVGLFLGILILIMRPEKWQETLLLLVLCLSPPVFMGIERANDDLVYLILLSAIPLILKIQKPIRYWLVWLVVFLLAPAKYYPGATFAIFLLEVRSWRLLGGLVMTGVVFLTAYVITNIEEILYLRHAVPMPTLFMVNGANLTFESMGLPSVLGKLLSLVMIALGGWILLRKQWPEPTLSPESKRWYLLGYSVTFFCFVLNSNYDYRFVYVLLMIPLLLELTRQKEANRLRANLSWAMLALLIPAFWLDMLFLNFIVPKGAWTMENIGHMTPIKNSLFFLFMFGATLVAGTLVRPNIRQLCTSFYQDVFRKSST